MGIEDEFSDENIIRYAKACFSIADGLVEKTKNNGFNTLLIPSRGAVPFFIGSMYVLQCLSQEHEDYRELMNRIKIPLLIEKYIMPSDASFGSKKGDKDINILLCPFTADINMQPFAESVGLVNKLSVEDFVNDTRKYWTKVVHALTKGKKERKQNPFFQFYLYLLRNVENRNDLANEYENSARVNGMAMIDTVISGRASMTILDAFRAEGVSPHSFLVVDNNKRSLKEPYATKIRNGESYGDIKTIPISRIFTEDRGASLEGVVGVIYPSLIFYANELRFRNGPFSPVGAGSWYPLPKNDPHEEAFRTFCSMLKSAVGVECSGCVSGIDKSEQEELRVRNKQKLISILKRHRLLVTDPESASYIKPVYKSTKTYETGSHVIHISFSPETSRLIINKFKREFEARSD